MIYPIVPIFVTQVLKAPVAIVELIEAIAEATASFGKFIFGYLSDKIQKENHLLSQAIDLLLFSTNDGAGFQLDIDLWFSCSFASTRAFLFFTLKVIKYFKIKK